MSDRAVDTALPDQLAERRGSLLIVAAFAEGAGSTHRALNIARGFRSSGYQSTLFSLWPCSRSRTIAGFTCLASGDRPIEQLKRHLAERPYDAVFLVGATSETLLAFKNVERSYVLVCDLVEDPLGLLLNCPWRPYSPGYWLDLANQAREVWRSYRHLWGIPDVITVITAELGELVRKTGSRSSVIYLPILAAEEADDYPTRATGTANRELAYCGSLSFAKDDIGTLLRAIRLLKRRGIEVRVHMFGHALRSQLFRFRLEARLRRVSDAVVWHGFVSSEDLRQQLNAAAALVLPKGDNRQNRYNFSTRLVDYLSTGRPCILARVGELPRYFEHGRNAFLFTPGDARGLSDAIERTFANAEEAAEIGRAGRSVLWSHFNASRLLADVVTQIERHRAIGTPFAALADA